MASTNLMPGALLDLRAAVTAAWPEVSRDYRVVTQMKIPWARYVQDASMSLPFAVIEIEKWGHDEDFDALGTVVYGSNVKLHYIRQDDAQVDVPAAIEERLETMRAYFVTQGQGALWSAIQTPYWHFEQDVTPQNPINESLLEANVPMTAGTFGTYCIVGELV